MNRKLRTTVIGLLILVAAAISLAQIGRSRRGYDYRTLDLADRRGVPDWEVDPQFKSDVFTFVRIRYNSWGRGGAWATDYPDSELNFSYRLQQLTSIKVNRVPIVMELTDDALFDYPFIYMIEPGSLHFTDEEIVALRRYLYNGGFLMVDDFWGEDEWSNFYHEIKRVFPDREPVELPLEHPIFHCVYQLKEKPQIPHMHFALRAARRALPGNAGTPRNRTIKPSSTTKAG